MISTTPIYLLSRIIWTKNSKSFMGQITLHNSVKAVKLATNKIIKKATELPALNKRLTTLLIY